MNIKGFCFFVLLYLLNYSSFSQDVNRYPVIPLPVNLIPAKGSFLINSRSKIVLTDKDADLKIALAYFIELVKNATGNKLQYSSSSKKDNTISFFIDKNISSEEGYTLQVTPKKITIKAKTAKGAFYAIQTLRQLMPAEVESEKSLLSIPVPAVDITDAPRFSYRGMLLDVSRHFFKINFLKKYIDLLAFYKINTFHLHLTDDQGWRIEIKKYPKLQSVSAWRSETQIGYRTDSPKVFDGIRHGGYYTQKQLKELVAYAQKRFVTIVPEIDMPGHTQSVLAAYPELGCIDSTYTVSTWWGVHKDILCPTEKTFEFLQNVLTEVMAIFPGKYIHIGGDEVPKDRWKASAFCQALIKKMGLKDEHGLQSYFIQRIEKFLNSHGRAIIGWDEILEGGIAPNATIMSWHGEKGGIAAAKQKHNAIMTPSAILYFNWYQTKRGSELEPKSSVNNNYLPLNKIYGYNPIPAALTAEESKYVLGAQGCLWSEYVATTDRIENLTFPRVCALSEVNWTPLSQKNYPDFVERLNKNLEHLKNLNINFSTYYKNDK